MFKDWEKKASNELQTEADILEFFILDDNKKYLVAALAQLPERERLIVELYIGIDGKPQLFSEIGKHFRISGGRTSQLFKRGIEKLRRLLSKEGYF